MPLDPEHRPRQPAEHYDPRIHVTAAALRKGGMTVPDNIPDHAWIVRTAVRPVMRGRIVDGRREYHLGGKFAEPFRIDDPAPRGGEELALHPYGDALRRAQGMVLLGPKGAPLSADE
jgi:hypothetical protein